MSQYPSDQTFLPQRKLKTLATKTPTPFYLYNQAGICDSAQRLHRAFSAFAPHRQFFPVQFCSNRAVLSLLQRQGCGVVCDSPEMVALALECGFSQDDILYAGLLRHDPPCIPIIDSPNTMPSKPTQEVVLVYNSGGRVLYNGLAVLNMERSRFGMSKDALMKLLPHLIQFGTKRIGLTIHGLTNEKNANYYPAVAQLLFELAAEIKEKFDVSISSCCLGDGLSVDRDPAIGPAKIEAIAKEVGALYQKIIIPAGLKGMAVNTALGQWLMAPNGIFLTKVIGIKAGDRPILITDAGIGQFSAGPFHKPHISLAGNTEMYGRVSYAVIGYQPDSVPFLERAVLPSAKIGDALVFHNAGCVRALSIPGRGLSPAPERILRTDGTVEEI